MSAELTVSSSAAAGALSRRQMLLTLISATAAYCVANATWWLQPVLIDQLVSTSKLSASKAGLVVSIEMSAMALCSYLLAKILRTARFLPWAGAGIGIALLGSYLSLSAGSFGTLILTRGLVGVGEGFCFMVANTAIVCFTDRERTFGNMGVINVLFGVALISLLPAVPASATAIPAFLALLIALALLVPAIVAMPPRHKMLSDPQGTLSATRSTQREVRFRIALLSVTTFIIGLASGVMWSFYGLIGQGTGLSEAGVNGAIATAIFSAIGGSFLAAVMGKSFGRIGPVTVALIFMTLAIACLSFHPHALGFRIATCVNVATLYFIMPYLFAAGSVQDDSGLGATYVGSAFLMTGAVSPFLGGLLVDSVGTEFVGVAVVVTSIISWLLFVYVIRRSSLT